MLLWDLHCHSSGISKCAKITYKEAINEAKQVGFDGIVLTNHYASDYFNINSCNEFIDKYVLEFENAKAYGETVGIKVIFGVEVTMEFNRKIHLLIYGISGIELKEKPNLFDLSIEELSTYCKDKGFALVQAHPFRGGTNVLDSTYLDGIEINCHPLYKNTFSDELITIAKSNHIAITCGCDYHGDVWYRPKGGLFLPESISTSADLAYYIRNNKKFKLQIHEINDDNVRNLTVNIN